MSNFLRFTHKSMFTFIILMLVTSSLGPSTAHAQVDAEMEETTSIFSPEDQSVEASPAALVTNLLQDSSFSSFPYETSPWARLGGQPLCHTDDPGCAISGLAPRTVPGWAILGRFPNQDSLLQRATIPKCGARLQFFLFIGRVDDPFTGADDFLWAAIDTVPIFTATGAEINTYSSYKKVDIPIPPELANGAERNVQFITQSNQTVYFNVDDVRLIPNKCFITGNAGLPGVKLSYTDGTPKTVISQPDRRYSFRIPYSWSGTVTPSRPCYAFTPPSREYASVIENRVAQNFTAAFNPASPCAQIAVKIKTMGGGTFILRPKTALVKSYNQVNNGPVRLNGNAQSTVRFIASERVMITSATNVIFFSELMGLPQNLLSTKYAFPWYDSLHFNSQLRIANISNATATVSLRIHNNQPLTGCTPSDGPYTLLEGESVLVSCAGANPRRWSAGPLVVQSSGGNIIASMRVLPKGSNPASFSEVMGVPASQMADRYAFPWYDNKNLDTQLRIGNIGNVDTRLHLFIGGVETRTCASDPVTPYPYRLVANATLKVSCPNLSQGPLKVVGSTGVPIVAALRMIPTGSTENPERFFELMGLPGKQFSSAYAFPWYNNKSLDTQLRVGNIGSGPSEIRLFIGGVEMNTCTSVPAKSYPYALAAGASLQIRCPNVDKGPVRVVGSPGVPIVASLRVLPRNSAPGAVFSELMGLALNKLTTGYVFPRYDNVNFNTQLRFAVP